VLENLVPGVGVTLGAHDELGDIGDAAVDLVANAVHVDVFLTLELHAEKVELVPGDVPLPPAGEPVDHVDVVEVLLHDAIPREPAPVLSVGVGLTNGPAFVGISRCA